ncbi:unnamed protein product, partial [Effrenium voratum]
EASGMQAVAIFTDVEKVRRALAASFNAQPRAQRKWLARFRARWGARLGVLKVQEVVPLEERQAKAFAFFKWINFALSEAPADCDPLIVNMDETALAYHIPAAQGAVATVARRAGGGQAVDHASLADTRGHVSYLATIASDPTVQPQLPQVILGNEHKFTLKALRSVAPDCPPNIHL